MRAQPAGPLALLLLLLGCSEGHAQFRREYPAQGGSSASFYAPNAYGYAGAVSRYETRFATPPYTPSTYYGRSFAQPVYASGGSFYTPGSTRFDAPQTFFSTMTSYYYPGGYTSPAVTYYYYTPGYASPPSYYAPRPLVPVYVVPPQRP
jgi:hypothetical protein